MTIDPEQARKRVMDEKARVEGLIHNLKDGLGDSSENDELSELQAALERIDNGTYGFDEVTGKPIAPERLDARPTARTNVDTEGQREGDGRLPRGGAGDPEEY